MHCSDYFQEHLGFGDVRQQDITRIDVVHDAIWRH